jgi:2-C-methyl-D-erythritol 4-phosphate cytidylyltransferase
MCGGNYTQFSVPKQTLVVNNERLIDRTIRLLLENCIKKENIVITISDANNKQFYESCGVDIFLNEHNSYKYDSVTRTLSGY